MSSESGLENASRRISNQQGAFLSAAILSTRLVIQRRVSRSKMAARQRHEKEAVRFSQVMPRTILERAPFPKRIDIPSLASCNSRRKSLAAFSAVSGRTWISVLSANATRRQEKLSPVSFASCYRSLRGLPHTDRATTATETLRSESTR